MKIAVIGAGLFGCTAALKLKECTSADVTLYEQEENILKCASGINQYRLHSGYHYPRSKETALQCLDSLKSFKEMYGFCLSPSWVDHYYAISKDNSQVNAEEYLRFLLDTKLPFEIVSSADWIDLNKIQLLIKVPEQSIDISTLISKIRSMIAGSGIGLNLGTRFHPKKMEEYDVVINATYSDINFLLPESHRIQYQFEICEKPVVMLPPDWNNRSFVLLDGLFFCIDPFPKMESHIMGHVKYAIHHSNIGFFPEIPDRFINYLNSPVIRKRSITNFEKFADSAEEFLPNLRIDTIGSMYTVRTVLPNRDHDDARPSYITQHSEKLYSIFSGKLGTCVSIANDLVTLING